MLPPRYLDGVSDEIADIYAQLETDILTDMARRIARLSKVTESTKWQAQLLHEQGALKKDIDKILKGYAKPIRDEIKAAYNDAVVKSNRNDNKIFKAATGRTVSEQSAQIMLANMQKTYNDLSRLTLTTAATSEAQFVNQANAAYMQVASGAFDYDSAMKNACENLAKDGVTAVQYRNGTPVKFTVEAAVRMNILTGINQTAANITLNNCDELDCDLVETSAHIGARPEHEEWQGKIFSVSGKSDKYPPFSICGLGEVTGICGVNCRHSFYPYFEGLEEHYTEKELDEMADQEVSYNGQTMTRYEGEQKLRGIERNIRKYKREAETLAAGGVDNTAARVKLGEWQERARDFTKQTGIQRDRAREFVGTVNGKQPTGITPAITTPTQTPATPAPTVTPAAVTTETVKAESNVTVSAANFASTFNNKTNAESTAELVKYINAQSGADNTVKEIYNSMNQAQILKNKPLTIKNVKDKHCWEPAKLTIKINKIAKNDPYIKGKIGTNIHEIAHLLDGVSSTSFFDVNSMNEGLKKAIIKARKYVKTGAELPQEIATLFETKAQKYITLRDTLISELNQKITQLTDEYKNTKMTYKEYTKKYNTLKNEGKYLIDIKLREKMDGVDALMDMYDALSEGYYQKNRVVIYGHGIGYFAGETSRQAMEIWANYCNLAIGHPDLITLLRKYEPDLVNELENTAQIILQGLRGTK